jgi:hypothetical protein
MKRKYLSKKQKLEIIDRTLEILYNEECARNIPWLCCLWWDAQEDLYNDYKWEFDKVREVKELKEEWIKLGLLPEKGHSSGWWRKTYDYKGRRKFLQCLRKMIES